MRLPWGYFNAFHADVGYPTQPSPQSRIIGPVVGEVEATSGMVEVMPKNPPFMVCI